MSDAQTPLPCDLLIEAGWVIPIVPEVSLRDHAVAVKAGRILEIGPIEAMRARYEPAARRQSPGGILTPGLVNTHAHSAMTLLRGVAEDLPLQAWLTEAIWPLEGALVNEHFVAVGTELAAAEMLSTGTTTFSDMYFFPEVVGELISAIGMRVQLAFPLFDGPNAWSATIAEGLSKGLELRSRWRDDDRVRIAFGPHAPYTVPDSALEKICTLADEMNSPVHIHLHENAQEVEEALAQDGIRGIDRLARIGLISPQLQAVHMTQLEPRDIELLATNGAHVVHCPHSNLKLASGLCPVTALERAGVNVAIGTDGAPSNNSLNLLVDTRTASMLAKYESGAADAGQAHQALYMATLGGARALGWEDHIGSIEAGKQADLALFESHSFAATPLYDPVSALLHTAPAFQASDVWVSGEPMLAGGVLTTIDGTRLRAHVAEQVERVQRAR